MEKSIARRINFLARKSQLYIGSVLEPYELTAAEQPFFMALQTHEGITQEELTVLVGVDKAVTTRVVRSLEAKGFLRREQDGQDRRRNLVYPTERTRKLGPVVHGELLHFNELLIQGMDETDLLLMKQMLEKMEENLSHMSPGQRGRAE